MHAGSPECDKIIQGLQQLKLPVAKVKPLLVVLIKKCPTMTGAQLTTKLSIQTTAQQDLAGVDCVNCVSASEIALQFDALRGW